MNAKRPAEVSRGALLELVTVPPMSRSMQSTARTTPGNAKKAALHFLKDPPSDLAESGLSPFARLVWLTAVRITEPLEYEISAVSLRRATGLDRLTFRCAVNELRAAGHFGTADDMRRSSAAVPLLALVS